MMAYGDDMLLYIIYDTYGHTGEDVNTYAYGPGSDFLEGNVDNTDQPKNPCCFSILGSSSFLALSFTSFNLSASSLILSICLDKPINDKSRTGWTTYGHTGEDVNTYAYGPGSDFLEGNVDSN
jgi:alkaline phosphatase